MLSLNPWDILWTVVNLLVLYLIFKKFLFQPVMNVINQRDEMIHKQFDQARQSEEAAAKSKEEYEAKLAAADAEADQILAKAKRNAEEESARAIENARKETERSLAKARAEIEQEKALAEREARSEIAKLAILAAGKIIRTGDQSENGSVK